MKEINELIKRIEQEHYHYARRELFPIETFFNKIYFAGNILDATYRQFSRLKKSKKKYDFLKEARKNFIINCVTATEVYFKDLVRVTPEMNKDIRNSAAIKELLINKGKVNLWDAYQIFSDKEFKIGDILVYYYSFQNIDNINIVMSKLLSVKSFFDEIGRYNLELDKKFVKIYKKNKLCLDIDFPEWKIMISEIFNLRHNYVHQINFKDKLGDKKLFNYFEVLKIFISAADEYFFETIDIGEK